MSIKIGILGYGNLGRGVECAVKQNDDMELVAVFTRRNPEDVKILTETATVCNVAERIAKDKACLTNLMNNLEKKGYVYRKEDPADRRNKLVFLTPEGEEFKDQIRPILDQVYVYAEKIIGIESIETMLSELKGVCDVLENV